MVVRGEAGGKKRKTGLCNSDGVLKGGKRPKFIRKAGRKVKYFRMSDIVAGRGGGDKRGGGLGEKK